MKNKKGFSLVELIIVIAIMALLIGFMAPVLIKYIEKTKVSSDIQLADTVRTAVEIAITDAKVVSDPNSQPFLTMMESSGGMSLDNATFNATTSVLLESLTDSIGSTPSDVTDYLRSSHGASKCIVTTTNGIVTVTFTCTDMTAGYDDSSSTPGNDISVSP